MESPKDSERIIGFCRHSLVKAAFRSHVRPWSDASGHGEVSERQVLLRQLVRWTARPANVDLPPDERAPTSGSPLDSGEDRPE